AGIQINAFVGTAHRNQFHLSGQSVVYSGPSEWSYRRMVLHLAWLAKAAGGVDSFLIGSELRGLTGVRSGAATFPFVDALVALATDVKAILGSGMRVSYAADWSEYFGYQPSDGSGDVYFHLDPLWASSHIDAVGIDCYWPLSDWRDGVQHLDALGGAQSIYDLEYLRGNFEGGEGYDWYYASSEDRSAQQRTPITDGTGKPWVFRYKDIKSWWGSAHYNRPGGNEASQATAWVPFSKPIWFTEIGCPAIDKGSNQPNVFVDPKSSENAFPYHSTGARDDFAQRRYLQAFIEHYVEDQSDGFDDRNPVSPVYGGRMVDADRLYCYCWDARPFPAFPSQLEVWGDGGNWSLGHWLNGRVSAVSLDRAVETLVEGADAAFQATDVSQLEGLVPGYVVDRVMSPRDSLQPLSLSYFFDAIESGGTLRFQHRFGFRNVPAVNQDELVETQPDSPLVSLSRRQETELPASAKLSYISSDGSYGQAVAEARRLTGASGRVSKAELPIVLEPHQARSMAESWLHEAWAARETARFSVAPSRLELEPGDLVRVGNSGLFDTYRIMEIRDRGAREVEAMRLDTQVYGSVVSAWEAPVVDAPIAVGSPDFVFVDLPLLHGAEDPNQGYIAAYQNPWPGGVAVYSSPETSGFELRRVVSSRSSVGELLQPLSAGVAWRLDHSQALRIAFRGGELQSQSRAQVLGGSNRIAAQHADGRWEVIQFGGANLEAPGVYSLTGLLRGQAGTDVVMRENASVPEGARVVQIDSGLASIFVSIDEVRLPLQWQVGPANRALGDDAYISGVHAYQGIGHRPYAPVHLRAKAVAHGFEISWVRQTRLGGDGWETEEVPLGEDLECYEIDIMNSSEVVRSERSEVPTYLYETASIVEDFGAMPEFIDVRVFQKNAFWGRGAAGTARIPLG
ncbi:MAG: glycoside hydrolase/phage tail family protein, partial [Pseudomonadota bacterium]